MQIIETSYGPGILTDQGNVVMWNDSKGIANISKSDPDICNKLADRLRRDVTQMDDISKSLTFPSTGKVPTNVVSLLDKGTQSSDGLRYIAEAINYAAPEES